MEEQRDCKQTHESVEDWSWRNRSQQNGKTEFFETKDTEIIGYLYAQIRAGTVLQQVCPWHPRWAAISALAAQF